MAAAILVFVGMGVFFQLLQEPELANKVERILRSKEDMDSLWQALFGWAVVGSTVAIVIGVGANVMSMSPPDYKIARICFSLGTIVLFVRSAVWIAQFNTTTAARVVTAFGICGVIGGLWVWSFSWISARELGSIKEGTAKDFTRNVEEKPPTLLDLFKKDFPNTMKASDNEDAYELHSPNHSVLKIKRQTYMDFDAKTKFVGFYIPMPSPASADLNGQQTLISCLQLLRVSAVKQTFEHFESQVAIQGGYIDQMTSVKELTFSGRVVIYHEEFLSIPQKAEILKAYDAQGLAVSFRGSDYLGTQVIAWHQQHRTGKGN